jgi:DNA ligase 4
MDESERKTKTNISDTEYDRLESRAHALPFHFFCKKLDQARMQPTAPDKVNDFFDEELYASLRPEPFSLYPLLTFMFPNEIIRSYNMQSKSVANLYINTVPLPAGGQDAKRLFYYKDKAINPPPFTGDFGSTLEHVLESRLGSDLPSTVVTLGEVDQFLVQLSRANAAEKRNIYTQHLLHRMSSMEHKWFVRIILDDLRLDFGVNTIFKTKKMDYNRLKERYNMASNLRRVCAELALNGRVDTPRLELLEPFQVHLSKRVDSLEKALVQMKKRPFYVERKVDGERYVVHKQQSNIKLYSRNCREPIMAGYYDNLQSTFEQRILVEECILDGEVVTWDLELGTYPRLGSNRTAALSESSNLSLMIVVFDIVYVGGPTGEAMLQEMGWTGGNELHQMPLEKRRQLLKRVIDPVQHKIDIVDHVVVKSGVSEKMRLEELTEHFQQAIEKKWEGLVVKSLDGKYFFGPSSRSTGTWVKLKPDYVNMGIGDMDLLILGMYYGKRGEYGQYLVGLKESEEEENVENQRYIPIAKVSAGLTDAEQAELKHRLEPHSIPGPRSSASANRDKFPPWIVEWKAAKDDLPDRWMPPSKSLLLEIECAEILESNTYALPYAFRFARIVRIRDDKHIRDTTSKREFLEIKDKGITFKPVKEDENENASKHGVAKTKPYRILHASSHGTLAPGQEGFSTIFQGKTMTVLPGTFLDVDKNEKSRNQVETIIKQHGGTIVPQILRNVDINYYIIGPSIATFQAKGLRKQDTYDILWFSWVVDCIKGGTLLAPQYHHYYCATPETRQKVDMDSWGDPFTKAITNDELDTILHKIPVGSVSDLAVTLKDVVKDDHFEGRVFYVAKDSLSTTTGQAEVVGLPKRTRVNTLDTAEMILRVYGADVSANLDARVTTLVTNSLQDATTHLEVVDEEWPYNRSKSSSSLLW